MGLPRHRPESAHLPEQPFGDGDPLAKRIPAETAALAREILQDRAGLENRDRRAVGPSGSMIAGLRLLGEIARKLGSNGSPRPMYPAQVVRQAALLEHDRNLPPFGVGH